MSQRRSMAGWAALVALFLVLGGRDDSAARADELQAETVTDATIPAGGAPAPLDCETLLDSFENDLRLSMARPCRWGLDPLDRLLKKMVDLTIVAPVAIGYVRLLIDKGAPVELSHLELADRLQP